MSTKWGALLVTLAVFAASPAQALCVTCNLFLEEDERYWMWLVDRGNSAVIESAGEAAPEPRRAIRWFGNGSIGIAAAAVQETSTGEIAPPPPTDGAPAPIVLAQAGAELAYATPPAARLPWSAPSATGSAKPAPSKTRLSPGIVPLLFARTREGSRSLGSETLGERVIPNLPELEVYGGGRGDETRDRSAPEASKPIPEPSAALVFGAGLALIGSATRRRV